MIEAIKQFFNAELVLDEKADTQQQLQLACAALLIELSRADFQQDSQELQAIERILRQRFTLDEQQLTELIVLAERESREATSLYQFTSLINDNYTPQQKFRLIKLLWEVAYADGSISKYEDHLIRKVAELIHLPHSEFIKAKLQVIDAAAH